jgi:predicted transcriptional regulator
MTYQEELQAKLDAVRPTTPAAQTLDTRSLEEQLVDEIKAEFEMGQYDLDESDILRTIKIMGILSHYGAAFKNHKALNIFYALAKTDIIKAQNLYALSGLSVKEFKKVISAMAKYKLLHVNKNKEIELTMDGQSLAERIGFNVFI